MDDAEKERMRERHRQKKAKRYREHMSKQQGGPHYAKEFIPAGSLVYFDGAFLGTLQEDIPSPLDLYLKSIAPTFEDLALSGPYLGVGDEGDRVNGRIKSTGLNDLKRHLTKVDPEAEAPGWEMDNLKPYLPKGKPPTPTPGEIAEAKEEAAQGWRVVGVDNFDRETVSDFIMCETPDEARAILLCASLNKNVYDESPTFYKVYEPGKELFTWEP